MKAVKYDHSKPKGVYSSMTCSSSEHTEIEQSVRKAEAFIKKAYRDWDTPKGKRNFAKWFGRGSAHSNENVKLRFKRAMDLMYSGEDKFWKVLCCKGPQGACSACTPGTLAYVSAFRRSNKPSLKNSSTSIRMCSLAF
jgi:hypothetical protein